MNLLKNQNHWDWYNTDLEYKSTVSDFSAIYGTSKYTREIDLWFTDWMEDIFYNSFAEH